MDKAPDAFRTISEVADELDIPQHVLRFWESRFPQIRPMKRAGGRRYYRPDDVDLLRGIKHLLYGEGYTIRGVQRILKENGILNWTLNQVGLPDANLAFTQTSNAASAWVNAPAASDARPRSKSPIQVSNSSFAVRSSVMPGRTLSFFTARLPSRICA